MTAGRPLMLDQVLRRRPILDSDGAVQGHEDVTVGDAIIEALLAGAYMETAAEQAGVAKQTVYGWLRHGAAACIKREKGAALSQREARRQGLVLTKREQTYADFSDAVAQAQAEAELHDVALLAELGRGGMTVRTVTQKVDQAGNVLEQTVRTETLGPSAAVLMWRLERRHPEKWGRRRIELTGADGGPVQVEDAAAALVASLRGFTAGAEAQRELDDERERAAADDG